MILHIKNMVCPRCINATEAILRKYDIPFLEIRLGEVLLENKPNEHLLHKLAEEFLLQGFELIDDKKTTLINQVKTIVIDYIHHKNEIPKVNWSNFLAEKLNVDYKYLSYLFSTKEGFTIEQFILKTKVEKIKELISYDNHSLSEIAYRLKYSSVAHLSQQFKKITGMTPSAFKAMTKKNRNSLDEL